MQDSKPGDVYSGCEPDAAGDRQQSTLFYMVKGTFH